MTKMSRDYMLYLSRTKGRDHGAAGVRSGEVRCGRCGQHYPLKTAHGCKVSPKAKEAGR